MKLHFHLFLHLQNRTDEVETVEKIGYVCPEKRAYRRKQKKSNKVKIVAPDESAAAPADSTAAPADPSTTPPIPSAPN